MRNQFTRSLDRVNIFSQGRQIIVENPRHVCQFDFYWPVRMHEISNVPFRMKFPNPMVRIAISPYHNSATRREKQNEILVCVFCLIFTLKYAGESHIFIFWNELIPSHFLSKLFHRKIIDVTLFLFRNKYGARKILKIPFGDFSPSKFQNTQNQISKEWHIFFVTS